MNLLFPRFTLCLVQDPPDERDRMAHETPEVRGAVKSNSEDRIIELEAQNIRLQGLVAELLFKNQRLRSAHLAYQMVGDSSDRSPCTLSAVSRENNDDSI